MSTIKHVHHYVPICYLNAWTVNEQLSCLYNNRIFSTKPKAIAQQKDFYKPSELTEEDISNVTLFLKVAFPNSYEVYIRFLRKANLVFCLKKIYDDMGKSDFEADERINTSIHNMLENSHCSLEGQGASFLKKIFVTNSSLS